MEQTMYRSRSRQDGWFICLNWVGSINNTRLLGKRIFHSCALENQAMKILSISLLKNNYLFVAHVYLLFNGFHVNKTPLKITSPRHQLNMRALENKPTNFRTREFRKNVSCLPHLHNLILVPCKLCYFSWRRGNVGMLFSPVATHGQFLSNIYNLEYIILNNIYNLQYIV